MTPEDKQALDELKQSVATLATAVEGMKDGTVDKETVAKIAEDVQALQQAANPVIAGTRPGGFWPGDAGEQLDGRQLRQRGEARIQALTHMPPPKVATISRLPEADVREFQQASDEMALLAAIYEHQGRGEEVTQTRFYNETWKPLLQAMDTATSAEGTEYVPKELSASVIERINLQLVVASLFPIVPMPTPVFDVPAMPVSRTRMGKHAEQTADTGQTKFTAITPGTRKVTLTAVKFAGRALVSKELEEDSIVAILPWLRNEMIDYLAADIEDCTINGDTAGTHQDSDVTASDDPRKNYNGLRKLAGSSFKTSVGATPTVANTIRVNRKAMGRYGVRPGNLAHICSMSDYLQLLADTSVLTLEKYGPNATILTGELGKVDGSPLIVSEYVRQDLNAAGVYDGTTTTKTELISVHTGGFLLGERRGVTVQVLQELYAESDQDAVIISRRLAFAGRYPNTEGAVAIAYNVTA